MRELFTLQEMKRLKNSVNDLKSRPASFSKADVEKLIAEKVKQALTTESHLVDIKIG